MSLILIERIANLNGPIIPDTLNGVLNGSEIDAHKFIITATRDGATVALTGAVTASFLRADGAEVVLTGEIENGAATVTLAQSCYAVPGRFDLTIFVTADGVKTGVYACTGGVRNTTSGTIVDPGQIVPSVDDIIAKQKELAQDVADASSAIASAQNAVSYLAPVFSTSKTYKIGEYVTQDGVLYICTIPVETAGAWDAANWQAVTFGEEVTGLKSDFGQISENTSINLMPIKSLTSVVNSVNVIYKNGIITRSGTATVAGGRFIHITPEFTLTAGNYVFWASSTGATFFIENASTNAIIATAINNAVAQFTLTEDTIVYVGTNLDSGITYNDSHEVQIERGSVKTGFQTPIMLTAFDKVARERLGGALAIVETATDLANTTAKRILVLHDNSDWGIGGPCLFEQSATWTSYGYTRNDGSRVFPVPNNGPIRESNAPKEQLLSIIQTWVGNLNLHHGASYNNDLFSENVSKDSDDLFEMDCSAFVCAILLGITYQNSRYVLGENADNISLQYMSEHIGPSKSTYMPKGGLQTSEMAMWFAQRGCLYEVPSDPAIAHDILQFGDILFGSNTENSPNSYYNIEHCMFVLGTSSDYVVCAESTNLIGDHEQQNLRISSNSLTELITDRKYFRVFARPNYVCLAKEEPIIPVANGSYQYSGFCLPIAQIRRLTDDTGEMQTSVPYGSLYADSRAMSTIDYLPVIPLSVIRYSGDQINDRNTVINARCYEYDDTFKLIKTTTIAYKSGSNYIRSDLQLSADTKYVRFSYNYLSGSGDFIRLADIKKVKITIMPQAST